MKKIILTTTFFAILSANGFSQNLSKDILCKKWMLEKYIIDSITYGPEKKEKNDFILLDAEGHFKTLSEGETEQGTWIVNLNGGYIILKNDTGETYKAYISFVSSEVLILKYDIEEIRDIEVRYKSQK